MFSQRTSEPPNKSFTCPECKSTLFVYTSSKLTCRDCGYSISTSRKNKYNAKRTEFNGKSYDSGFEADESAKLALRKRVGDIKDYDIQYKIEVYAYLPDGMPAMLVKHKVDFRIHHNDGSYELYEAKGIETDDYKWRRKFLENLWLPLHKDHIYTVVKQNNYYNGWSKKKR
jgi:DNA-directed RNA polymerase subunit M/transcription elongation factor TFIIS